MNKKYLIFSGLLLLCCTAFVLDTPNTYDENRLALIIGNSDYTNGDDKLKNPTRDADKMKTLLEGLGFEVIIGKNLTLQQFNDLADSFEAKINELKKDKKPLVTLFYYSGHGMNVSRTSFLIPVNCKATSEADLVRNDEYGAFQLNHITNRLAIHGNFLNIVLLDACRTGSKAKSVAIAKGKDPEEYEGYDTPRPIVSEEKKSGMFYGFATEKGEIARDGYGDNSPFVKGFENALKNDNLQLETVFKKTGDYVTKMHATQRPCFEVTNFYGDFYFKKTTPPKDTDGDGFPDYLDSCPLQYAPNSKNGCLDAFDSEMVFIQGGTFFMGSNEREDEQPIHSVTVNSFYMGKYEVTVAQFREFVNATNYKTDAEKGDGSYVWENSKWVKKAGISWRNSATGGTAENNHPVVHVSWNDATAYIQWLSNKTGKNYRLPTEAEWEYAAGNGNKHTKYSWGDGLPVGKKGGNVADETAKKTYSSWTIFDGYTDGYVHTAPVGQFEPNDFGLYDMTGNVWEWCSDWYGAYSSAAVSNPKGAATGSYRVIRGGSWYYYADSCRSAYRFSHNADIRNNGIGFRVCLSQF